RSAIVWDLDSVAEERDWVAGVLSQAEIDALPNIKALDLLPHGTMVLWQKLDRLAAEDRGDGAILSERVDLIRRHLSLVFHRFLSSELGHPRLSIVINGNPVVPVDPFLADNKATQLHPS